MPKKGRISVSDVIDGSGIVSEIKKVTDGLLLAVNAIEKAKQSLKGVSSTGKGGSSGLSGLASAEKEANTVRAQTIKMVGELEKLEAKLILVQGEYNKRIQQTKIQLKQENDQIKQNITGNAEQVRIKKLQAIVNKEVAGSYNALDAQYRLNIISLNHLTQEEIENSAAGKKLAADTKVLHSQLQAMDQSTARNRTGYNGLRFSMIQVGRELPSMAYGFNVFMAAISNNLPMVTDEIKKAKMELAALKAEGKVGVPIWKQMAGAIFSWQTALIMAITVLTVFGKQISDRVKSIREENRAINELKKSHEGWVKQLREEGKAWKYIADEKKYRDKVDEETRKNSEPEKTRVALLVKTINDLTIETKLRKAAFDELNNSYPTYLEGMKFEDINAGKLSEKYKALTQDIVNYENAKASETQIQDRRDELVKLQDELTKFKNEFSGDKSGFEKLFSGKHWGVMIKSFGSAVKGLIAQNKDLTKTPEIIITEEIAKKEFELEEKIKQLNKAEADLTFVLDPSRKDPKSSSSSSDSDSLLEKAKRQNELKLQEYRHQLEEEYRAYSESTEKTLGLGEERDMLLSQRRKKMDEDLMQMEYDLNYDKQKATELGSNYLLDIIEKEKNTNIGLSDKSSKEILKIEKEASIKRLEIEADAAKLTSDIIRDTTKNKIDNANEVAKFYDDILKEEAENEIARMYEAVDKKAIVDSKAAANKIKAARGNEEKIAIITDEYQEKLIDNEISGIKDLLSLNNNFHFLSEKQEIDFNSRLKELQKKRSEEDFDDFKAAEKKKLEFRRKMIDESLGIINAGFELQQQLLDNQLSRAERVHELELQSAVESIEGRMLADAKYDKKKREIEKKQAILKKAQGSFNVIIDTAQAIMEYTKMGPEGIPLAIAAGILGGIELTTILTERVPAYNKGKKNAKGGLSILGDSDSSGRGGSELVIEPSGKAWLSSNKSSLYDITPNSDIYPADETQKILAAQALNNDFNIIELGETNNLLKSINNNGKELTWTEGNYRVVKRGNKTTKYAIRGN